MDITPDSSNYFSQNEQLEKELIDCVEMTCGRIRPPFYPYTESQFEKLFDYSNKQNIIEIQKDSTFEEKVVKFMEDKGL